MSSKYAAVLARLSSRLSTLARFSRMSLKGNLLSSTFYTGLLSVSI